MLIRLNIRKTTNLSKYNLKAKDVELIIDGKASLADLLKALPMQTHNGEAFGLQLMTCNRNHWSVQYYSHFSNKFDEVYGVHVAKSPEVAVKKMLNKFMKLGNYKLLNVKGQR